MRKNVNGYLRPTSIIFRYIVREITAPFLVSIFVFTGILFLVRSLKLIDLVINKNVPVGDILLLFSYIVPRFLEIAVPMSVFLAVIIGFGRLSADSELVVLRSVGLSLKQVVLPVMAFACCALLFTFVLGLWIRPWANYNLGQGLFEIAKMQTSAGLVSGTFNELGQLTIYAEHISENGEKLDNVLIGDNRNPELSRTFVAKHGKMISDKRQQALMLELYDGSIQEGRGQTFNVTRFEINSVQLPHSELLDETPGQIGKRSHEMYLGELMQTISTLEQEERNPVAVRPASDQKDRHNLARYRVELQRRFSLPCACVCVSLIAMALGIQPSRGGHTWGAAVSVGAGILLILIYYFLFAVTTALAEEEILSAFVAMWLPNVLFLAFGGFIFRQVGSEKWLAVSEALGDGVARVFSKLRLGQSEPEAGAGAV